jgi:hypothetical protein
MKGERQMLPLHTIRIRAASPMTKIGSARDCELGDEGGGHGLDRSVCPSALSPIVLDGTRRGIRDPTKRFANVAAAPNPGPDAYNTPGPLEDRRLFKANAFADRP